MAQQPTASKLPSSPAQLNLTGTCQCGSCAVTAEGSVALGALEPRICDCAYCQQHPSALISHPQMSVVLVVEAALVAESKNGSGQATFYECSRCGQLLAVGAQVGGTARGAVNAHLFGDLSRFAAPVPIQPRLLSADQKAARWSTIWGALDVQVQQ